jgi:AGCS family alanine or glycine:cation symporter
LAILGGTQRIEKFTSFIIPAATLLYVFLTLAVILRNPGRIPHVFKLIISDAFAFDSALGGSAAFIIISKMREGFSRGLLSNEAGAGTSAFAHARNRDESPVSVGLVGMCEVLFDTVVLCMLTGIAVLISVPSPESYSSGLEIVKSALSSLGSFATPALTISIFAFAYSTVICWYYYGKCALSYFTKKGEPVFALLFILSVFFGAIAPSGTLIVISDYLLFFSTIISLATVIKNSDRLRFLSENEGLITKDGFLKEP